MTNKEIAKEIAYEMLGDFATSFLGMIDEYSEMFCTEAAFRMAKWKDQQFKEYLERKIEPYIRTNASPQGTYQEGFDDGYTSAINEIINELFKEE